MHSRHRRAQRIRVATTTFSLVVGTALSAYLLWRGSEWALNEWVFRNSAFGIAHLQIETDGIVPVSQLKTWAGVKEGDNLFAVDLPRIKRDLELQSLVHSAAIERVLPKTLRIRVREREPVAQILGYALSPSSRVAVPVVYGVDVDGFVMQPFESVPGLSQASAQIGHVPALTGIAAAEILPGKRVESPSIYRALRLIETFGHSAMARWTSLRSIDLSLPQVLQVTTREGNEITLGFENIERQLQRWQVVHVFAQKEGKAIAALDLSVANNVPARWQEAPAGSAAPLPPAKPSPYRKKNV